MKKIYIKAPATQSSWPHLKWLPLALVGVGTSLMVFVTGPILTYELVSAPQLRVEEWLSPGVETAGFRMEETAALVKGAATAVAAAQEQNQIDYTLASNWFPEAIPQESRESKITHYTIDIPKLKIKNAVVAIGDVDLKKNLIQYRGTASPGELGVPVIFGHSILRQFYNPSEDNPARYVSIFSTIMTLEAGDQIHVNYDGIKYTYVVRKKYQVEPKNIEVLGQRYDQKLLRLITCVPEGTYLHRGVVEAVLEPV